MIRYQAWRCTFDGSSPSAIYKGYIHVLHIHFFSNVTNQVVSTKKNSCLLITLPRLTGSAWKFALNRCVMLVKLLGGSLDIGSISAALSGAPFSKLPVITGRWAVLFSIPDGSFKSFENYTVKLLAKQTKWTSFKVTTHPTFLETLI